MPPVITCDPSMASEERVPGGSVLEDRKFQCTLPLMQGLLAYFLTKPTSKTKTKNLNREPVRWIGRLEPAKCCGEEFANSPPKTKRMRKQKERQLKYDQMQI